jgi:hypothetical protein
VHDFPVAGRVPIAFGIDLPGIVVAGTPLTPAQHGALEADLASDR